MTTWSTHRTRVGRLGEAIAASVLARHGVVVVDQNVRVGRGEIDLIGREGRRRFAVEVKTADDREDNHPVHHFTTAKRAQVADLARSLGIHRIDLVTVRLGRSGARVEWHRRV